MRSSQALAPVLQVRPRLLRRRAAEGGETREELEEDAAEGPVVDGEGVGRTATGLEGRGG